MAGREQKIIDVKIKGVNDLLKLKKELKALKKEQSKVKQVNKEGEKSWIDKERAITKATKKYRENRKELTRLNKEQKKGGKGAAGFTKGMLKAAAAITVVVGATRILSRMLTAAFKTFTEFEFSMAKVRAISGATNEEFVKLEQSAKELGRTTFFTAKQVAELQVNFSKLGFSAEEILNLQEATLDLAMATGSDLARSAMVAGSAVRGFGLRANEATRVVDVMAVAFTNSALDIEKWQTSMTKVSAIAASIGVDIEGTAAVMGSLADTGIEASIAGTSLRNIFLKMANPTSTLAKRIGFTVNSTEDMIKALKLLKDGQIGQLEMQNLVDVRQVIAMESMIQNIDVIEKYTTKLNNATGAGREMADIMEDTSKGAFKKLQSAMEGLALAFSERIAPVVNKMAGWFTKLAGSMTKVAEVPLSEKLKKEQIAMNNLFNAIRNNNTARKTSVALVQKANRLYADMLGYELQAIDNGETLFFDKMQNAMAQEKLNDTFEQKIKLQAAEEVLNKAIAADMENQYQLRLKAQEISKTEAEMLIKQNEIKALGQKDSDTFIEDWEERGYAIQDLAFKILPLSKNLVNLKKDQEKMNEEMKLAPDHIKIARDLWLELGGIIPKITAPIKCPEGMEWDKVLKKCVPKTKESVRDFAQELAEFQVKMRQDVLLGVETEITAEQKVFDKKVEFAKAEWNLFQDGDKRKTAAHLKYLKAIETADRNALKNKIKQANRELQAEKYLLAQQGRDKEFSTLELKGKELELERAHLKQMLIDYKGHAKKIEEIDKKLAANKENITQNDYELKKETQQFAVELAQMTADATFQIMSNNLARERAAAEKSISNRYDGELRLLDMQLAEKEISQADYNGKVLKAEVEREAAEDKVNREFARKERNIARAQAVINGALAITKAYAQTGPLATFVVPMLVATTMAQLAVIEQQQFAKGGMIEEFSGGGMVHGKSHAQGGEKFAVGGRVVELEGGEAVINKRSASMFRGQLSAMNSAGGGVKFADGGLLNSGSFNAVKFNASQFNQPGGTSKVVVVESDITDSQSKVRAIQSNASF